MQKRKDKGNSNLTVTQITNVHNLMVQKLFQSLSISVAEEVIVSSQTPYGQCNRSSFQSKKTKVQYERKCKDNC